MRRVAATRIGVLGLAVVAVSSASAPDAPANVRTSAALLSAAPSPITVTITAAACRVTPTKVPEGGVRFTIANRSRLTQRFVIAGHKSAPVRAGRRGVFNVTLGQPASYPYRCVPTRGTTRRGSLRVAHAVVIETDMAPDDVMAILYLLSRPDVDVLAIAVNGDGEAHCPTGATNALSLVALAGQPNIPVGCGRSLPLQGTHAFPTSWRQYVDDFFGLPLPAAPAVPIAGPAEQLLRSTIESHQGTSRC